MRELARVRFNQRGFAARDQSALAKSERGMKRRKKFREAGGQVANGVEALRRGVHGNEAIGQ